MPQLAECHHFELCLDELRRHLLNVSCWAQGRYLGLKQNQLCPPGRGVIEDVAQYLLQVLYVLFKN